MSHAAITKPSGSPAFTVVGIDVGGMRKGFHAVAITGGEYSSHMATTDVEDLAHWCRASAQARFIAIDAPCRWSNDGTRQE